MKRDAERLILALSNRGFELSLQRPDSLRIEPLGLGVSMLAKVAKNKPLLLWYLRTERHRELIALVASGVDGARAEMDRLQPHIDRYAGGLGLWYRSGAMTIDSELLGARIVICESDRIAEGLPDSLAGHPVYTLEEVGLLDGLSSPEIQDLHAVKTIFQGHIRPSDWVVM